MGIPRDLTINRWRYFRELSGLIGHITYIYINIYKQEYYIGGLHGGAGSDIFDRLLMGQT
jgi:hypothetical protein